MTSKSKAEAGPDDLLLLVQHWARDEHVYPTKDDRHNIATILIFQSYTSVQPAKFVHSSKIKTSEDPLGEADKTNKNKRRQERKDVDDGESNADDRPEFDDDSDTGNGPENENDLLFDSDNDSDDDVATAAEEGTEETCDRDSGYNSDRADITMTDDTDDCFTTVLDGRCGKAATRTSSTTLGRCDGSTKHSVTRISASGLLRA
jgi:hypothetical protein